MQEPAVVVGTSRIKASQLTRLEVFRSQHLVDYGSVSTHNISIDRVPYWEP